MPSQPAEPSPQGSATSTRLHLIANSKSGKGAGGSLADLAKQVCDELGAELVVYSIDEPGEIEAKAKAALLAAKGDGGVLVAAGGDGTIRTVAQHAQGQNVRFAVIPCGTFNFFARTHSIPEDQAEALRIAINGRPSPVRLGEVNGEVFLINASLGLYAKAIREREMRTDRWGRNRFVVIISTILSLLSRHRLLEVDLIMDKKVEKMRTPMIFIGNNALQLRDLSLDIVRCMKKDLLAAVTMKPLSKWEIVRVLLRGFSRTLEKEQSLDSFCVDSLTIRTRAGRHTVALDGEIFKMTSPLQVSARPGALNLMKSANTFANTSANDLKPTTP